MRRTRLFALAVTVFAILSLPAAAQGRGKGKEKEKPAAPAAAHEDTHMGRVTSDELRIIHNYYATNHIATKPLPPGIAKNLQRGKPIPPGIERTRVSVDLVSKLTPRPGSGWFIVGDRLVLVDADGRVVDIVQRVF
jgi:hypothetical protein